MSSLNWSCLKDHARSVHLLSEDPCNLIGQLGIEVETISSPCLWIGNKRKSSLRRNLKLIFLIVTDHVCGEDGLCDTAFCKDPFGGVDTHARSAENDAQKPELKADIIKKPVNEVWGEATQILTSCEDPSAADGSGPALHSSPLDQGGGGALRGPLLDGGGGLHRVPEAVGGHALRAHLLDGGGGAHGGVMSNQLNLRVLSLSLRIVSTCSEELMP